MKTGQALVMISGHTKFITWLPDFTEMFDCSKWKAPKRTVRKTNTQAAVFNIKEYLQAAKQKEHTKKNGRRSSILSDMLQSETDSSWLDEWLNS